MENWFYKQGEQKGEQKGIEKALAPARKTLVTLYEARFGPMPPALRERVQAAGDPELVARWSGQVIQGTHEEADRALATE